MFAPWKRAMREEGIAERKDGERREHGTPLTVQEAAGIATVHIEMCEAAELLEMRDRGRG
jgi:hypothetical protein